MLISCYVHFELLPEVHIFLYINLMEKLFAAGCG